MYRKVNKNRQINKHQSYFISPVAVVSDNKKNHLIVSNKHCLQWFDLITLRHVTSYEGLDPSFRPENLCLQPNTNRLVVCDSVNHRVQVFCLDEHDPFFPDTLLPLFAIGKKPFELWVEGSNKKGEFNNPSGVCCSPNGDIHVTDSSNHRVQSFDAAGRFLSTFGSHGVSARCFFSPFDICFVHSHFSPSSLASGILCVSDTNNKRVSVWSGNNTTGPSVDSPQHLFNFKVPGYAYGLCVDLKGYLHVSCGSPSNVVQIFDLRMVRSTNFTRSTNFSRSMISSALIQTLGKDGGQGGIGSEPGEFFCPTGMCVDGNNTLMVLDSWNYRVQFFDEKI